jgi:hypothetical protein
MPDPDDFLSRASSSKWSLFRDVLEFLRREKKWWLTPLVVTLVLVIALVIAGGTAAGPFLYTLF